MIGLCLGFAVTENVPEKIASVKQGISGDPRKAVEELAKDVSSRSQTLYYGPPAPGSHAQSYGSHQGAPGYGPAAHSSPHGYGPPAHLNLPGYGTPAYAKAPAYGAPAPSYNKAAVHASPGGYGPPADKQPSYGYNPRYKTEVVFSQIFSKSKAKVNPSDEDSPWNWFSERDWRNDNTVPEDLVFDNAHLRQQVDHLEFVTIPYRVTGTQESRGFNDQFEAAALNDEVIGIEDGERIRLKTRISGETVGTEHHPFPAELVTDAQDDFRLASVHASLFDTDNNAVFAFWLTNKGIWAAYTTNVNPEKPDVLAFIQSRRLATRAGKDAIHNLAIEYDSNYNKVTWFIEGKPIWWVDRIGYPSHDRYAEIIRTSNGNYSSLIRPRNFQGILSSANTLDARDPNKHDYRDYRDYEQPPPGPALVKLVGEPNDLFFYSSDTTFSDNLSLHRSRLFGQGSIIKAYEFELSVTRYQSYPSSE